MSHTLNKLTSVLGMVGILGVATTTTYAAGFQLWEQDAASLGSYHAGYAAEIIDASTSFYNPAGITRFKNQQIVFGGDGVITDFKYEGTIGVNTILGGRQRSVTAQGGNFSLIPFLNYVAPLTDWMGFGFSIDVPFGSKTTYGRKTILQYAATTTAATIVDISPALGFQPTDKFSFGFGLDIQRMNAEFDSSGGSGFPTLSAESINKVSDTGYGGHVGVLYQFTENSRVGVSYHSQVVHHLNGTSQFVGPYATAINEDDEEEEGVPIAPRPFSSRVTTNMTLPPYLAASIYQRIHPKVALMATAIYTRWNIFKTLQLNGVSGVNSAGDNSNNIQVIVLQYYRNTWNFSVGANYYVTDKITLRTGLGYDQTPVTKVYRTVQLPDNNRVVLAFGGHYQATPTIGVDAGWQHFFLPQTTISPQPQRAGAQVVTTNGIVNGGADVLGAQLTWDIV